MHIHDLLPRTIIELMLRFLKTCKDLCFMFYVICNVRLHEIDHLSKAASLRQCCLLLLCKIGLSPDRIFRSIEFPTFRPGRLQSFKVIQYINFYKNSEFQLPISTFLGNQRFCRLGLSQYFYLMQSCRVTSRRETMIDQINLLEIWIVIQFSYSFHEISKTSGYFDFTQIIFTPEIQRFWSTERN